MKIMYWALTSSTTHLTCEGEFKSVRSLKIAFNRHLRGYEPEAWIFYAPVDFPHRRYYYDNNDSEVTIFNDIKEMNHETIR